MKETPEELQQRIAAYIDGELSPAEAARLEVYLANTDPALADGIVGMLADKVQVRALPKPHAPPDLAGRIMEQIERTSLLREDEPVPLRRWWQSRAAIAAGLAVVLGGFSYFVASSVLRPATDKNWTASGQAAPGALAEADRDRLKRSDALREETLSAKNGMDVPATVAETKQLALEPIRTEPAVVAGTLGKSETAAAPPVELALAPMARSTVVVDEAAAQASSSTMIAAGTQIASAQARPYANETLAGPVVAPGGAGGAGLAGGGGFGGGRGGRGGRGGGAAGAGAPGAAGVSGASPAAAGRGAAGGGRAAAMSPSPAVTGGAVANGGAAANGAVAGSGGTAMTAGMSSFATAADNTVRALADITRDGRGPMVVTFLARDDQDYARLAAALASYASANLRQNLNTVLANGQAPLANFTAQDDPRNGLRQMPAAATPNNFAPNTNSLGANNERQTFAGGNNSSNASGNVSVGVSNGGVVYFDNRGINDGNANGFNGGTQFNYQTPANGVDAGPSNTSQIGNNFNGGQLAANQNNTRPYSDQNLIANDSSGGRYLNDASRATMLNVRQAETRGGPYRVALRAGQLEELSRNYRLAIVARGEVVVQFHALGDQAPLTADAKEREILLRKAGLNSEFAAGTQIAAQNAAAAAAVPGAGAPAPTGPVPAAPAAPAVSAAAPAAAAPVLTGRSQIAVQDKDAPVTIDCVITMEPAPAAAPGAAPGARTPAP